MDVTVEQARDRIDELLDRAEAGEEVILTRNGQPAFRLVREPAIQKPRFDRRIIDDITRRAKAKALPGPDAAHSQDHLYDERGLPI